ncbi:MAG TPA: histidine kinase [Trebonia sp.]
MVIANLTRRLFPPGPAAAGNGTAGRASAVQPAGLLAELRDGPVISQADVSPVTSIVRAVVLVMVVATVPLFTPHFGQRGTGLATAVALAVCTVSWVTWQLARGRPRLWLVSLAVLGAAGGALAGLSSASTAVAVGAVVAVSAGARLSAEVSFAITAETVAAFLVAGIAGGATATALVGWTAGLIGLWAFGLTRRAYVLRAVEAEEALEQARRALAAETQAAALAERARIAREIHDVLAHSLAAVSVNLQAAGGLLEMLPDKGPEVAKAIECVERAGALSREGMTETRRAVLALRDDDGGTDPGYAAGRAPGQLVSRLQALADEHGADGDAAVGFTVTGTPRPLGPDAALTAFRTAQEALTNARRHAPGRPASLTVSYTPGDMTLQVDNPLVAPGAAGLLAHAGAGYGLTGLRERAALAGGTLTAGPAEGRWRVLLRLPA